MMMTIIIVSVMIIYNNYNFDLYVIIPGSAGEQLIWFNPLHSQVFFIIFIHLDI